MLKSVRSLPQSVARRMFKYGLPRRKGPAMIHLGSSYGGWTVPEGLITPSWIRYTAGVGEDASFDLALAEIGCDVVAIDPTPRAIQYVKSLPERHSNLRLAPYALWHRDTELDFFPPENPRHVSFSATNRQRTVAPIRVPGRTVATIMEELSHPRVDLLKLDIEGAEYSVLDSLRLDDLGVRILCVEYHNDHGISRMLSAARRPLVQGFEVMS